MENWVIKNKKADFSNIMQQCKVSEVIARCLVNKGLEKPEEIMAYLYPKEKLLHSPNSMKDMVEACNILYGKIRDNKRIRIIGDYDVDGVIATYVLLQSLKKMGAEVDYEIPDRIKDGYGINLRMVEEAFEAGIDTIITCDNGIVAMEQLGKARELGMTVIVTDHHSLFQTEENTFLLPEANAIVNPKQLDCSYPFKGLCGAAIAYKLMVALLDQYDIAEKESFLKELLSYVAIATVCDVMDLVDENRYIVKQGIELLKTTKNKGLLALMDISGIDKTQLSVFHLGFVIGPCLNASGRLNTAKKGLELLLTETEEAALSLAEEVKTLNNLRKEMTQENVERAIHQVEHGPLQQDKVLVIYLEECHESIAGIIAGRIRERYHKPAIVLTDAEGCVKGSARSIEHYNMIEELCKCRDLLLKVGGHPMAAGLSLLPENVELLRIYLNNKTELTEEMLIPKVKIDILLPFGYITEKLIEELKLLEPHGKGNERPLFAEKDLQIKSLYILGKNSSGVRIRFINTYGKEMEAVYFGDVNYFFEYLEQKYGKQEVDKIKAGRGSNAKLTITYYPKINEYNGVRNLQIMIYNYR